MALTDYYEPFFVQELVEKPSPFPPPFDKPIPVPTDGDGIMGMFKQSQSTEAMIASAKGIATFGKFACDPSIKLESGTIVRRVRDGAYMKVIGTPLTSPPQASTQVSTWESYIINRSDLDAELRGGAKP